MAANKMILTCVKEYGECEDGRISVKAVDTDVARIFKIKPEDLKSVSWHIYEDDYPQFERKFIAFESKTGEEVQFIIRDYGQKWEIDHEIAALNKVFEYFRLLPAGKIIDINWSITDAVNYARKLYPYTGKQWLNERQCRLGYELPEKRY